VPQLSADEWERGWQSYWKKAGFTSYELPVDEHNKINEEHNFLMTARTRQGEIERLKRITAEFIRGFKGLSQLGPAVTVFGSARFKPNHPYYKLAREVGGELARRGFTTLTGRRAGDYGGSQSRGT
jgi:hypothetical protein